MKRTAFGCAVFGALIALTVAERLSAQTTPPDASATNDTAYAALRVMSQTLGKDSLERVVELTGRDGMPQPYLWKIVLRDGTDGTREVDVAGSKIMAQRTAAKPPPSKSVIRLQDLNLDSSGAFDATDAQARKVRLRFDSVNYVLRTSESTGKPQWTLSLFNQEGADVGAMRLSANDGNILSTDGRLASGPTPSATPRSSTAASNGRSSESTTTTTRVVEPSRTVSRSVESRTTTTTSVGNPPPPPPPSVTSTETVVVEDGAIDRGEGGLFTRTGRTLDKTSRTVEQTLRKTGSRVQRFFTGHNDSDQEEPRREPDPNYRGD